MKPRLILVSVFFFVAIINANAQGGYQRRTPEERTKATMEKLADLKLDKDQTAKTDTVFSDFYKSIDKARDEMGQGADREQMREKFEKLSGERDDKLKKIFTADQYKKFKDEIEPAMRQQRRQGN